MSTAIEKRRYQLKKEIVQKWFTRVDVSSSSLSAVEHANPPSALFLSRISNGTQCFDEMPVVVGMWRMNCTPCVNLQFGREHSKP